MRKLMMFSALSLAVLATACGKKDAVDPCAGDSCTEPPPPPPPPPPPGGTVVVAAAGNIAANNGSSHMTAQIIDTLGATAQVIALGDNDRCGTPQTYSCFDGSWGRFKARARGAIGNHEYDASVNTAAQAHFAYWGATAGNAGEGWYAYDAGDWRVIVLNVTDEGRSGGLGPSYALGQPQANWLAAELQANAGRKCTLAVMHSGYFLSSNSTTSSGAPFNTRTSLQGIFGMLSNGGVDVVLTSNEHWYERFAPMTTSGTRDDVRGVVQFNVGTGGEAVDFNAQTYMHPNSAVRITNFGVLKLTLKTDGFDFAFINATNPSLTDAGSGSCH